VGVAEDGVKLKARYRAFSFAMAGARGEASPSYIFWGETPYRKYAAFIDWLTFLDTPF
jgi:hypothetical protein